MKPTASPPTIVTLRPLYLRKADAAAYLSISESMLDILAQEDELLKPRKLSSGRCGYLVEDLDAWGRARPKSDLLPPEGSGYGRAGKPVRRPTTPAAH